MAKDKKSLNTKLYAITVFFLVGALLATITVSTYKSRYTGFSPEKTAVAFVQSIVDTGDGYNSYKNTIMSKNYKYGDYIREYYMYPVIYRECDYTPGDDRASLKGFNDESYMSDKTKNDNGVLSGKVIDTMYSYYEEFIADLHGWDNYDEFFTRYFDELCKVRKTTFGDDYMTDEIMFTALEANVLTYGKSLTGTEDVFDSNTGLQTSVKSIGAYEKAFGENCKITYEAIDTKDIEDLDSYKTSMNSSALETYKISVDDIKAAKEITVEVNVNGESVAKQKVSVVLIKSTWYVDNTSLDTKLLYSIAD
ncbi:MAG: hypothetical protein J6A43_06350 [Clostridia bacterium]|nr:hypothetical protein [Clostridia bacterium]